MCDVESCGFITSGKSGGVDRSVISRLSNVPSTSIPQTICHHHRYCKCPVYNAFCSMPEPITYLTRFISWMFTRRQRLISNSQDQDIEKNVWRHLRLRLHSWLTGFTRLLALSAVRYHLLYGL